jgi:histidine triad (HIT) family protein
MADAQIDQNCIFCQLANGYIPTKMLYSDDICCAFLDINPASFGHILLLPKNHYPLFPAMPPEIISHVCVIAKKLSQCCLKGLKDKGIDSTNIVIANGGAAGQKAPHAIIHIIPRKEGDDLFKLSTRKMNPFDNIKIANSLINAVNAVFKINMPIIKTNEVSLEMQSQNQEDAYKSLKEEQENVENAENELEEDDEVEQQIEANKKNAQDEQNNQSKKVDLDKISKLFGV